MMAKCYLQAVNLTISLNKVMYKIDAHAVPTESSEQYGKVIGAYVVAYIDYADIDGAYELVKYYIADNGWKMTELEEEYFIIDSEKDVEDEQLEYFNEALEHGYSLIFYSYISEKE